MDQRQQAKKQRSQNPAKNSTLHASLKWTLIIAQLMGQMPVAGVAKLQSNYLKFTWKSWQFAYCVCNFTASGFITIIYIYRAVMYGISLTLTGAMAFHLGTCIMTLLFLRLAIRWPNVMQKWNHVEQEMQSYGTPRNLHIRIVCISGVLLSVSIIEYILDKLSWFGSTFSQKGPSQRMFENYVTEKLAPEIFHSLRYSHWLGVFVQIVSLLTTFAWTFTDMIIMLLSTGAALRFRQITDRLAILKGTTQKEDVVVWREIRKDYNRVSKLARTLDDSLNYIVLISFGNNLFFVLMQLFHSLSQKKNIFERTYAAISFAILILRIICVTVYGAWIYEESTAPIYVLQSISSEQYNIEIKRFIEQLRYDKVALTGKLFNVTRGVMLSMAGVIASYELILMQFNQEFANKSDT